MADKHEKIMQTSFYIIKVYDWKFPAFSHEISSVLTCHGLNNAQVLRIWQLSNDKVSPLGSVFE